MNKKLALRTRKLMQDEKKLSSFFSGLQDYLRAVLPRDEKGYFYCLDDSGSDYDRRWVKTRAFCRRKKMDYEVFKDHLNIFVDFELTCEGDLVNHLKSEDLIEGFWKFDYNLPFYRNILSLADDK